MMGWALTIMLCFLTHLERTGRVERVRTPDEQEPERWRAPRSHGRARLERGQDRARRRRLVQRVEVDARRAAREQVGALQRRVGDAQLGDRLLALRVPCLELLVQGGRDGRAAHAS